MAAAGTETSLAAAREAGIKPGDGYGLTVIIPTKDRPLLLRQTVKTVLAQSVLPLQVVIIDQSREPAARAPLAASATRHPSVELVYLHAPEIPSAAAARNRAMSVARGTIWLFLDDDVILEPGFTAALVASYRQQPRAAGISGVITNYAPPKRLVRCWQGAFYRGPFADDRQPVYWHAHLAGAQPLLIPVSRLGAGLMSFWPAALAKCALIPAWSGPQREKMWIFAFGSAARNAFSLPLAHACAISALPSGNVSRHCGRRD